MNNTHILKVTVMAAVIGLVSTQANAQTGFGTIPGASGQPYSGNGIPFNTSEYDVFGGVRGDTVTVAMAATQHGSGNPAPANNGAGTYTANLGLVGGRSTWNFDFYISTSQNDLSAYTFSLVETANGHTFSFDPTAIADDVGAPGTRGNSESLDFSTYGAPLSYNPNANDTYNFELETFLGGTDIGNDSITVITVPDSVSTGLLLGLGLAGLAVFGFKQNRFLAAK